MINRTRKVLAAAVAALIVALCPAAAQAEFGVAPGTFEAGTCVEAGCTYSSPHSAFYTQAAGHPPFGITAFELKATGSSPNREPEGAALRRIRVDVPAGLAANPEAPEKCPVSEFEAGNCETKYPGSRVATNELVAYAGAPLNIDLPKTEAPVFNLQQPPGLPLDFGIEVAALKQHIFLEGHVAWWSDYHEYFEIKDIPQKAELEVLPKVTAEVPISVLESKLVFKGRTGGNFLTLPSECSSSTESHLEVESWSGQVDRSPTTTPVGVEGCAEVPFEPVAELKAQTSERDTPDGGTAEVRVPQFATSTNTADIRDARVTLPEGMTLNPSAAHGLTACTAAQIGIGTTNPVSCPASSKVGSVLIETDLPPGSLEGNVYLGSPGGGAITDPPFTVYIDAESELGVSVRLQGQVSPDPSTGRLEVSFLHNPQLPFSSLALSATPGARAPLANPLECGKSSAAFTFTPWTGLAAFSGTSPFTTGGGSCPAPAPLAMSQSVGTSSPNAGAYTSFTFDLARGDGTQYLQKLATTLPAGVVGEVPAVPRCGEPAAASGDCPASSRIGTATATVGAGPEPYEFSGPVYLTGPYAGAPYGLSIPIEAAAGPFDLGRVVTRAQIGVDTYSGRVIAVSDVPTIVKGVPLRLKSLSVTVDHPNFMVNPTSCAGLTDDTRLTSTFGTQLVDSSPFAVGNCGALQFKPTFSASTSAKTSRANGASLRVTMTQGAHQANLHSAVVSLPTALPSRLTTLQKACAEATYAANPLGCPPQSVVGTATVHTPVLPEPLSGPATLVSHGGAAFPDLDILLQGDGGVSVILVGNTNIKNGITTSSFASIPDVPVSSFELNLPTGPHSALAAFGDFCKKPLTMPTTLTAQNGATVKQSTRVSVRDCGVRILKRRVRGHRLVLTLQTFAAGRVTVSGRYLHKTRRKLKRGARFTIRVPLSRGAVSRLRAGHRLKVKVRVAFAPSTHGEASSHASTTVRVKR